MMTEFIDRLVNMGFSQVKAYLVYHELLKRVASNDELDLLITAMEVDDNVRNELV